MRQFFCVQLKGLLLALAGSLLLTLSFPRYGSGWLAWLALLPLLWIAAAYAPRPSFKLGWLAGLGQGLGTLYWIVYVVNRYGSLSLPVSIGVCLLLVSYLALLPALFTAGLSWLRLRRLPWLLLAAPLWVSLELAKSNLFTGFPWENLGYSQFAWLPVIQVADLTGVYGLSFAVVLGNAALCRLLYPSSRRETTLSRWGLTLTVMVVVSSMYFYGTWRLSTLAGSSNPSVRVALIQGNIPQEHKWDPAFQQETLERYFLLSKQIIPQKPDLLVWPETATPFYFRSDRKNSEILTAMVRQLGKPLLFGSPAYQYKEKRLQLYNRAYLLNGSGSVLGFYDKIHLVPFGEYVPLKRLLFFARRLVQAAGDFVSGNHPVVLSLPPARLGVLICYEAIFPELSRDLVRKGANILVNITNDAWFGPSSAPYQHLSMAVLRTVENRVPMVRCANTGISAFVDASGRVLEKTALFQEAVLS
ncbi:MAG: apolipoprotein N-acyltransferase, partial [Deltaproteobacteria bacterium]|nr:apolipoprotein N-acyltransferase [Deltaproteobacteria bacterium]